MSDITKIEKIHTSAGDHEIDARYWGGNETLKTINGESLFGSGDISIPDEVELIEISGDMLANEPTYTATEALAILEAYYANKLIVLYNPGKTNYSLGWFIPNIFIRSASTNRQVYISGILGNFYIEQRFVCDATSGSVSGVHVDKKIDLTEIGGSSSSSSSYAFGTCSTAAATGTKTVTLSDSYSNFTVSTGSIVAVKFTYTNTVASTSLKLSVAGVTAQIKYLNTTFPSSQHWLAGSTVEFVYDGSAWQVFGTIKDNVKVNQTLTSTNSSYPLLFSYTAGKSSTGADEARFSTGLKYNPSTQSLLFPAATSGKSVNIGLGTKPSSPINGLVIYNASGSQSDADFINICAADVFIRKADGSMGGRIFAELNGNASTATTLETPRTINGMTFNGSANVSNYVICDNAADVIDKELTVPNIELTSGTVLYVKFTNGSTSTRIRLKINGDSTNNVKLIGVSSFSLKGYNINNLDYYKFIFDGSVWWLMPNDIPVIVEISTANYNSTTSGNTLHTGVYYKFTSTASTSMNLTSIDSTTKQSFTMEITTGTSAPTITFPSTWKWVNGVFPVFEANKTYQISTFNNCAVCASFSTAS